MRSCFGELGAVAGCRVGDRGAGEVEFQPLVDHGATLACRRGAAHQRVDARHEDAGAIGLGNKIVRAERHGHDLVDLGRARGEDDDGDLGFAANLVADMLAVLDGKREVEQHQVGGAARISRETCSNDSQASISNPARARMSISSRRMGSSLLNDKITRHGFRLPPVVWPPLSGRETAGARHARRQGDRTVRERGCFVRLALAAVAEPKSFFNPRPRIII